MELGTSNAAFNAIKVHKRNASRRILSRGGKSHNISINGSYQPASGWEMDKSFDPKSSGAETPQPNKSFNLIKRRPQNKSISRAELRLPKGGFILF
jgi:hypothetical protein